MLGDFMKIDFVQILLKSVFISGNVKVVYKVKICKFQVIGNFRFYYLINLNDYVLKRFF